MRVGTGLSGGRLQPDRDHQPHPGGRSTTAAGTRSAGPKIKPLAIKKCLTQNTENMDAKPDGEENMSKLSEEKTSKSVYNEPILPYLGSGYKDVEKARMSAMFEEWVIKHNRMYRSMAEKEKRFLIFYSNVLKIEAHNNSGCYSYTLGLNEFSDLTEAEFRRKHVGVIIRRD
ncbi:cysteine proteinase RD21a-like protein [Cinnamomum micranthum f. kanehirae]|uniref:Cysteine proteinase RD21a-like protein n=1 Tax=Cinnamomum micranthum f. kanehirae TaxID=337451 RepID=A0A3S3NFF8_9MAGN|nr:cysteine proteinase RD21a-like protein [Cinnamomum micranthum f. kanehirae]